MTQNLNHQDSGKIDFFELERQVQKMRSEELARLMGLARAWVSAKFSGANAAPVNAKAA